MFTRRPSTIFSASSMVPRRVSKSAPSNVMPEVAVEPLSLIPFRVSNRAPLAAMLASERTVSVEASFCSAWFSMRSTTPMLIAPPTTVASSRSETSCAAVPFTVALPASSALMRAAYSASVSAPAAEVTVMVMCWTVPSAFSQVMSKSSVPAAPSAT